LFVNFVNILFTFGFYSTDKQDRFSPVQMYYR